MSGDLNNVTAALLWLVAAGCGGLAAFLGFDLVRDIARTQRRIEQYRQQREDQ